MRFIVVQEPTDTWAVFDTALDEPADFTGQCLIGLTRDSAKWFAARCNQEASRRGGQRNQTAVVAPACLRIRLAFTPVHGDEMFDASLHMMDEASPPTVNGGNTSGFWSTRSPENKKPALAAGRWRKSAPWTNM